MKQFNERLAVWITKHVSTMWAAYFFAILALIALPQAVHDTFPTGGFDPLPLITWVSQCFLQLVLLAIIMVGQDVMTRHHEQAHKDRAKHGENVGIILQKVDKVEASQQKLIEWMGVLLRSEILRRDKEAKGGQPRRQLRQGVE